MTTQCTFYQTQPENPQPGDMWYDNAPELAPGATERPAYSWLSTQYWRDHFGKRPPLFVVCPGGDWWGIDQKESRGDAGWDVTGEPPNITARPSILTPNYHGWLTDGVFSDPV